MMFMRTITPSVFSREYQFAAVNAWITTSNAGCWCCLYWLHQMTTSTASNNLLMTASNHCHRTSFFITIWDTGKKNP